jgi:tight adherence protein C
LPDALDLLVICAQAGLSLSPAMGRVAAEMMNVHPAVATELALTVRELEILPSAAEALHNLARRTGLATLDRLGRTLAQTLQYGTPLTDALRNLAAETRQQVLTRFEGRAAQLPVLLTLPMILFILPCVFIIAGGPAVLQVIKTLSH